MSAAGGASAPVGPALPRARSGARRTSLIPPQHGAWAFLGLPLVLGALVTPGSWSTLLLVGGAFTAYPASYFVLCLARARRGARFRRPLLVWTLAAALPAVSLVAARPWLVWVGLGYAALFAVNLAFAGRNHDRDLSNDAVLVAQAVALVPLTWLLAAPAAGSSAWMPPVAAVPERVWLLTVICALALIGSTLHVKSLLRERRNPAYAVASRSFALASLLLAVGLAWAWGLPAGSCLLVPSVALVTRANKSDWSGWRPAQIGLVELACFVLVAAASAVALVV